MSSVLPSEISQPKRRNRSQLLAAVAIVAFPALAYLSSGKVSSRVYLLIVAVVVVVGWPALLLASRRFRIRGRPPGELVAWERNAWSIVPYCTRVGGVFGLYSTRRGVFVRSTAVADMASAAGGALAFLPAGTTQLTLFRRGPLTLFLKVVGADTLWFKFAPMPWMRHSLQRADSSNCHSG